MFYKICISVVYISAWSLFALYKNHDNRTVANFDYKIRFRRNPVEKLQSETMKRRSQKEISLENLTVIICDSFTLKLRY